MKHHVVFAVKQENFTLSSAQLLAESLCELYRGKSSPNDDDSHWLGSLFKQSLRAEGEPSADFAVASGFINSSQPLNLRDIRL